LFTVYCYRFPNFLLFLFFYPLLIANCLLPTVIAFLFLSPNQLQSDYYGLSTVYCLLFIAFPIFYYSQFSFSPLLIANCLLPTVIAFLFLPPNQLPSNYYCLSTVYCLLFTK